jgi:SnoaL-like domain
VTPAEAADHAEITRLQQRYFRAMDTWDYELLDGVFTPDARLRYDALQGVDTSYREMLPSFRSFNSHFSFMQHMGGQLLIEVSGDTAGSSHVLRAIHVQTTHDGAENEWVIYGIYHDRLVRTGLGWRIGERRFRQTRSVGELLPFDRVRRYDSPPWLAGT